MLLDNFTIIAQLINFLILIWLLKRFLYGPLLTAIDAREQRLRDQQNLAQQKQEAAKRKEQELVQQQQEFEKQQTQLLLDAHNQAETERQQLIDQARRDIAKLRSQWQQRLTAEHQELTNRLRKQTEATMLQTLGTMVTKLTSHNLQQAAVATFIERLTMLDDEQKKLLYGAPSAQREAYQVVTARDLTAAEKERLEETINAGAGVAQFHYQTNNKLLCGLELHHGGHKLSWSLASHLDHLQQQLASFDRGDGDRS